MPERQRSEHLPFFGYGSLLWKAGFEPSAVQRANLSGYRRSFCMRSVHHRGSPQSPGLVLALDECPGASCDGMVFWPKEEDYEAVHAMIRERELVTSAYREEVVLVRLSDSMQVRSIAYVVDRDHPQYCGGMPLTDQATIIAAASGISGDNRDYLARTVVRLAELAISDPELEELLGLVNSIAATDRLPGSNPPPR